MSETYLNVGANTIPNEIFVRKLCGGNDEQERRRFFEWCADPSQVDNKINTQCSIGGGANKAPCQTHMQFLKRSHEYWRFNNTYRVFKMPQGDAGYASPASTESSWQLPPNYWEPIVNASKKLALSDLDQANDLREDDLDPEANQDKPLNPVRAIRWINYMLLQKQSSTSTTKAPRVPTTTLAPKVTTTPSPSEEEPIALYYHQRCDLGTGKATYFENVVKFDSPQAYKYYLRECRAEVGYGMPVWAIILIVLSILMALAIAFTLFYRTWLRKRLYPKDHANRNISSMSSLDSHWTASPESAVSSLPGSNQQRTGFGSGGAVPGSGGSGGGGGGGYSGASGAGALIIRTPSIRGPGSVSLGNSGRLIASGQVGSGGGSANQLSQPQTNQLVRNSLNGANSNSVSSSRGSQKPGKLSSLVAKTQNRSGSVTKTGIPSLPVGASGSANSQSSQRSRSESSSRRRKGPGRT